VEKIEYSEAVTKLSICTPKLQKIIPLNFIPNIQTQSAMMKIVTIFTGRASATFTKKKEGNSVSCYYKGALTIS